jgi:hypothetical protein
MLRPDEASLIFYTHKIKNEHAQSTSKHACAGCPSGIITENDTWRFITTTKMATMMILASLLFLVATKFVAAAADDDVLCVSETNTYTVRVNLFTGELGYFSFDECPSMISPTIGMKINETYTFNQSHRTNYYHPMGFSYYADGAHDEQDELEPGIPPYNTSSSCGDTLSCPSPMYFRNGTYLGTYSNIPQVLDITQGEDNFGLDDYEPLFFRPLPEWAGFGGFEVKLRFDVEDFTKDIFYFCHVSHVCFAL